jgi:hypothetical protein
MVLSLTGTAALAFGLGLSARSADAQALTRFSPRGSGSHDHSAFDALLQRHVRPDGAGYNRVDYRGLKTSGAEPLKAYVAGLQAAAPSALSASEAHAYWINLYNAMTLVVVLDHYPVASIRRINLGGGGLFGSGPWSRKLMNVESEALSLDDVEHRIVRPVFGDPMSHYGLNCASYSCPNLMPRAYTGANLASQLLASGRAYVNHPRGVAVSGSRITASRIYDWYGDDFGGRTGLKPHWQGLAEPSHGAAIAAASIGDFAYDWTLNDV